MTCFSASVIALVQLSCTLRIGNWNTFWAVSKAASKCHLRRKRLEERVEVLDLRNVGLHGQGLELSGFE
eukprot:779367-Amphidinium_carterae.1